ncbi:hypothetical protein EG68_09594 [Paragonimus skrjabini miyazakii]|uniref:Uncharacterized protein n=1 Tax=Paragonimus skrjabini miyazakii TaxID=59628 RepID=A0A8S9YKU6_9TREM|nr:hypothetical protein EG68_09594 [Paragonimus skrjabini miyazakii]
MTDHRGNWDGTNHHPTKYAWVVDWKMCNDFIWARWISSNHTTYVISID